jgi:hypothetical protein
VREEGGAEGVRVGLRLGESVAAAVPPAMVNVEAFIDATVWLYAVRNSSKEGARLPRELTEQKHFELKLELVCSTRYNRSRSGTDEV